MHRALRLIALATALSGCFGELHPDSPDARADTSSPPDVVADVSVADKPVAEASAPDAPAPDAPPDAPPDASAPLDVVAEASVVDIATPDVTADTPAMDLVAMDAPVDLAPDLPVDARPDVAPPDVTSDAPADAPPDPSVVEPRLVAPLSVSRVTRRVRFEWNNAPGNDGAQLEVCSDRACAMREFVVNASGESFNPAMDISPGVHWWRLRGRRGGVTGSTPTNVWEFYVPPRRPGFTVPAPKRWGAMPDFNGDGRFDLLAGAPAATSGIGARLGAAYVFLGTSDAFATTPALTLTSSTGRNNFGQQVSPVGDVNGDGFVDFAVGAVASLSIFRGGTLSPGLSPARIFEPFIAGMPAGDVNHDGFGDVVIWDGSRVAVYLGGAGDLSTTPARMVGGVSGVGVGDLNNDGNDDVAIQVSNDRISIYPGSIVGLDATPLYSVDAPRGYLFSNLTLAGDVNADGIVDLIATATSSILGSSATRPTVILLNAPGARVAVPLLVDPPVARVVGYGSAVAGAGDFNGDGVDDTIVGTGSNDNTFMNQVCVYAGSATGPATTPTQCVAMAGLGRFGASVGGTGDLDRDGFEDLLAGARGNTDMSRGTVRIYRGRAAGLTDPMIAPFSAGDANGNFAASIGAWR